VDEGGVVGGKVDHGGGDVVRASRPPGGGAGHHPRGRVIGADEDRGIPDNAGGDRLAAIMVRAVTPLAAVLPPSGLVKPGPPHAP
jgi:hypothetical protein